MEAIGGGGDVERDRAMGKKGRRIERGRGKEKSPGDAGRRQGG